MDIVEQSKSSCRIFTPKAPEKNMENGKEKKEKEEAVGGEDKEGARTSTNPAAGGDEGDEAPVDGAMLLPGATRRNREHRRAHRAGSPTALSAADVDLEIHHASSPAVRAQSGESLGKIQPAAARWRKAVAMVVAVGQFVTAGAEGGGDGGGSGEDRKSMRVGEGKKRR